MNCVDEYYLDKGSCTVPVQVLWGCFGLFLFSLLFPAIFGFPTNREDLGAFINFFANIFCATSPFALSVTEFSYFFIFLRTWEQIILGIIIFTQFILAFFIWEAVVILNVCVTILAYSYYLINEKEGHGSNKQKET